MITGREKTRAGEWGATWLVPSKCLPFFFPSVLILLRGEEREAAIAAVHNKCRDVAIFLGGGEGGEQEGCNVNQSGPACY